MLDNNRSFFADWIVRPPDNENGELLQHCGSWPISVARETPTIGYPLAFDHPGAVAAEAKHGEVTLARFDGDGGAAQNRYLMQFQSDLLGHPVHVSAEEDLSAYGVSLMALALEQRVGVGTEYPPCRTTPSGRKNAPNGRRLSRSAVETQ